MKRSLKIRLYPNKEHQKILTEYFGASRFVYNKLLDYRSTSYKNNKIKVSWTDSSKYFYSTLRIENEWLKEFNTKIIAQDIKILETSFINFFRFNKGYPKFKSKNDIQSLHFSIEAISAKPFNEDKNLINFTTKIKGIKFKTSKKYKDFLYTNKKSIKSATISKTKTGKYYASILIETEELPRSVQQSKNSVGIDLGIKTLATCSNGQEVQNPKWIRSNEKKLKKLYRQHSKKVKGSKNREKARLKLAKAYEKIKNQKQDFLHNLTTKIINENQVIVLEDLNVSGMMKNHNLAKSIQELSLYEFKRQLDYKSKWYGRTFIQVDRYFPSSKKCSSCGNIKGKLNLSERVYKCECCGKQIDRDFNASLNILKEGLRILKGNKDFKKTFKTLTPYESLIGKCKPEFTLEDNSLTG